MADNSDDNPFGLTGKPISKHTRTNARRRMHRRFAWLEQALFEAEWAIDDFNSSPGRTRDPEKLNKMKADIASFRKSAGFSEVPPHDRISIAEDKRDALANALGIGPYIANTAPLMSSMGVATDDDDELSER